MDSLIEPLVLIEFNIQKLQTELEKHFDQLEYLKGEQTDFSSRQEIQRLNELIENKKREIDIINYRIHLHKILLSEARRLEYYPSIQRPTLINELMQKLDYLNKRKILYSEVGKKQLPERMNLGMYSNEFPFDCQTNYFSASKLTSTKSESLFSYTPAEIEGSTTGMDFLNAEVSIVQSSKKIYLDLRLTFNTAKAAQIYGLLEASQSVKLEFMDASYIYLNATHSSTGEVNYSLNQCMYHLQFPLDDYRLKELRNKNTDKLTVIWEKGKEVFEIYQIDIIQKLIKCLNP